MRQVIFDKKEQIPYGEHSLQISGEKLYFFALKKGQGVSRRRVGLGPLLDNVLVLVTICLLPELFDSSRQGGLAACGAHCGDDDTCFLLKNESATIGHLPDPFGCRRRGGEARQRVTKQDPAGARATAGFNSRTTPALVLASRLRTGLPGLGKPTPDRTCPPLYS